MTSKFREAVRAGREIAQRPLTRADLFRNPHAARGKTCLGHRLATALLQLGTCQMGYDAWASMMGANRAHLILMLRNAGAGADPLCHRPWFLPGQIVWEYLEHIQSPPTLVNADMQRTDLFEADLQGADLSGADLYRGRMELADLRGALLKGANMRNINLTGADLRNTDISKADLTQANLRGADLREANLTGTNLNRGRPHRRRPHSGRPRTGEPRQSHPVCRRHHRHQPQRHQHH